MIEESTYVEDCSHFNSCEKNQEGNCRGCNIWIAKYHIEDLPKECWNYMFDCYCMSTKELEKVKVGYPCICDYTKKCEYCCDSFKYARKMQEDRL